MGFIDDKSEIFEEIAANRALRENFPELNKTLKLYKSIDNKNGNMIPFLLDMLVEVGDESLKENVFKPLLEKSVAWENTIKETLIENVTSFYTKNNNVVMSGITNPVANIKIKDIDLDGTLKIEEDSDVGKFYYGEDQQQLLNNVNTTIGGIPTQIVEFDSNVGGNFTLFLKKVLKTGTGKWKNIFLFEYNENNEELKVNILDTNQNFETFIKKSINSIKLFDLSKLMSSLIDFIYGSITNLTDIGRTYLEDLVRSKELIDKIINKESLSETEFNTYDNSFFVFTKEEQDAIKAKTDAILNGTNLSNLGCGQGINFVDMSDFEDDFNNLNNFRPSLVKNSFSNFTDKLVNNSTVDLPDEDKESSLIGLIKEFIKSLPALLFKQVVQPYIVMITQLSESIFNNLTGGVNLITPSASLEVGGLESFIINFREQSVCIIKKIYSLIVEYIFKIIKSKIISLVAFKIAKITKEKTIQYTEQVKRARELLEGINNILSFIVNNQ